MFSMLIPQRTSRRCLWRTRRGGFQESKQQGFSVTGGAFERGCAEGEKAELSLEERSDSKEEMASSRCTRQVAKEWAWTSLCRRRP